VRQASFILNVLRHMQHLDIKQSTHFAFFVGQLKKYKI